MYSTNCEVGIVNGQIVAYCKTSDFTTRVRQAVSDEMFWRDLLQRYNVDLQIPNQVKYQVQNIVPKIVQEQLDNYTKIQIPSHVAKNMAEQVTGFLNNHNQMNQILLEHSLKLNEQLTNSAKDTLDRVTNEEQYHQVTNSHLKNMNNRFEDVMKSIENNATLQLDNQNKVFYNNMKDMHDRVAAEIKTLKETNEKLKDVEKTVNNLEGELFILKGVVFGLICGTLSLAYFMKS